MDKITIIVNGHEYESIKCTDAFGYRGLAELINEVLEWQVKPKQERLRWLPSDPVTHIHPGTNYDVFSHTGQRLEPFLISMRDLEQKPELYRVFVNKPVGYNG